MASAMPVCNKGFLMLKFEEEVVEFEFRGEKHRVSKPTMKQSRQYRQELAECKNEDDREMALISLLSKLGLKEEVSDELSQKHMTALLKTLGEAEKN